MIPAIAIPPEYSSPHNRDRQGRYIIPTRYFNHVQAYCPEVINTHSHEHYDKVIVHPDFWSCYNRANIIIENMNIATARQAEAQAAAQQQNPVFLVRQTLQRLFKKSTAPVGRLDYDFFENILNNVKRREN